MAPCSSAIASNSAPLLLFVIALLLVRSKPATIPIRVYLAELRALLKGEANSDDNSISHTYLDTIAYWRTAFGVSQEEIRSLQAQVTKLEGRNDDCFTKNACPPRKEDGSTRVLRGKRKMSVPNPPARPTRVAKQARLANTSSPMQSRYKEIRVANPAAGSTTILPITNSIPDTPANDFLYHVSIIQQFISNPTAKPQTIAFHLQRSVETISSLASLADNPEAPNQIKEQSHTGSHGNEAGTEVSTITCLNTVGRMIPMILQAMDHVTQTSHSQISRASIVFTFVKTYSTILHRMCNLAAQERLSFSIATSINNTAALGRVKWSVENSAGEPAKSFLSKQSPVLLSLSNLAIAMTNALQPANPVHLRMLEGCLSLLLTKIGSGLQISVFGTGATNDAISELPHEEEAGDEPERDLLASEADRIFEAQAPYLIYILERTPTKPPNTNDHDQSADDDNHTSPPSAQSQTATQPQQQTPNQPPRKTPSTAALRLARKKLQNTLLAAVFPDNVLGLMKETLNSPPPLTSSQQQQQQEQEQLHQQEILGDKSSLEVKEWYKREVLRLVGWEALDEYLGVSIW